jgi:hypothetical protein
LGSEMYFNVSTIANQIAPTRMYFPQLELSRIGYKP